MHRYSASKVWGGLLPLVLTCGFSIGLSAAPPVTKAPAKPVQENCLDCHGDNTLTKTAADGKEVSLFVDIAQFKKTVHGNDGCTACHKDVGEAHANDGKKPLPVDCASCHTAEGEIYKGSIHGMSRSMGSSAAASCSGCHGHHDIVPVKQVDSRVFKMNLPKTCATCHANGNLNSEYHMKYPEVGAQYLDSIHGRALLKLGLIVAPSCNDCHGVHDIKRIVDRSSPINHANVAKTCGRCHVKVEEVYNRSIHGQLLAKGDPRAPVCTTCHSAHQIEQPSNAHFKAGSDQRCGQCHEDRLERYHETYHGKAMALGRPNKASEVAACYDCHGHHDVLPASDPNSRLSKDHIVGTCAACHTGATASFARYVPHADPFDKANYPQFYWVFVFMTALLLGTFTFFGAHTLFWLVRSLYLYMNDSKTFREAKISTQKGDEWFTRFTPFQRFLHILVVTSFLLLVLTGMPLKFYYSDWAKALFNFMGGPDVARSLHHFGAIVTFLYFGLHLADLVVRTWRRRDDFKDPGTGRYSLQKIREHWLGPDSMIPTMQDWRDFVAHQKWFFGRGPKPEFDRWTYWEKFDYLAVFWGVFIIGISGLIMWFPMFFAKFMPGWIINIALIIHSDEALLAAGFIFTVHFFNTHFRLEKFPMDTVIFSGRISKTEMLHERKRWYDRLLKTGKIADYRIRDEWERWKSIARTFGYIFFGMGVILLILIVYAMASRLLH